MISVSWHPLSLSLPWKTRPTRARERWSRRWRDRRGRSPPRQGLGKTLQKSCGTDKPGKGRSVNQRTGNTQLAIVSEQDQPIREQEADDHGHMHQHHGDIYQHQYDIHQNRGSIMVACINIIVKPINIMSTCIMWKPVNTMATPIDIMSTCIITTAASVNTNQHPSTSR